MNILALKLIMVPIILGGASLAGRRWGPMISGWLIGLPLTSGPVAFFVAFSHDSAFLKSTILGTLSGGLPLVIFILSYAWMAVRFRWQAALAVSIFSFILATLVMQFIVLPLFLIFLLVLLAILLGLRLMPAIDQAEINHTPPGKWDLPARIILGTCFILIITGIAPYIGARLTGLLSTIPLFTAILTIFAHRLQGPSGATSVLKGLLYGLFGFAGFYLVLALSLEPLGLGFSFISATLAAIFIQGFSFLLIRKLRL